MFKNNRALLLLFVIVTAATFLILTVTVPEAETMLTDTAAKSAEKQKMDILRLTSIGDSLTEGIGDLTEEGGYVPLLQKNLEELEIAEVVQADNFGKSGDRSDQILKRIKKDDSLQQSVAKANLILLTVGGNDLMKTVKSDIFNDIELATFKKPLKTYQAYLQKIYDELRNLNPTATIYQLGIYNPFYLNFPDLTEMQDVVDFWNQGSQEFVQSQDNAYFVPINDDIYSGLTTLATTDSSETAGSVTQNDSINNLISGEDNFHPNNLGYQIIANAFRDKIAGTKQSWLQTN
ncbi:SGNH/GDSL hydrolase family protein [Vagococcus acidifermentans]|nr:SGNH/GDSL hydrolase family protein [Vagococcus acidifermentans]